MIVYGKNVAQAIFRKSDLLKKIRNIYVQDNVFPKIKKDIPSSLSSYVTIKKKIEMDRLETGVHQGIIIEMEDYQYTALQDILAKNASFLVILDHLEDPHNLGAIIRTAVAAGVDAIILPHDREVGVSKTVIKTSAGTIFDLDIVEVVNLKNTIDSLKKEGFWFVGTSMDGEDYKMLDYNGKIALVIGNEGKGMSRLVREACDFLASIPMKGDMDSLNASVAAGIMIYEVVRNRK